MLNFCQLVIHLAAWWYERVISPACSTVFDWFFVPGLRYWPRYAHPVANFFELRLVPFLLGAWLVWPIAEGYLRDKWEIELREANRLYALERTGHEGVCRYAKCQHVVNEALPDARRPRTLPELQGTGPLTVDGVSLGGDSPAAHRPQRSEDGAQAGQFSPVFSCREVKEAGWTVKQAATAKNRESAGQQSEGVSL